LHEDEGTIIDDKKAFEKMLGALKMISSKAPQARATDFAPWTIKAGNDSFRMLVLGSCHFAGDAEEVAHHADVSEGHSGLRHPKWPMIHADEQDLFSSGAMALELGFVWRARIVQRVVSEGEKSAFVVS